MLRGRRGCPCLPGRATWIRTRGGVQGANTVKTSATRGRHTIASRLPIRLISLANATMSDDGLDAILTQHRLDLAQECYYMDSMNRRPDVPLPHHPRAGFKNQNPRVARIAFRPLRTRGWDPKNSIAVAVLSAHRGSQNSTTRVQGPVNLDPQPGKVDQGHAEQEVVRAGHESDGSIHRGVRNSTFIPILNWLWF